MKEYSIKVKAGKKIKELRERYGITQETLAEQADIDYKYLQRIEGKRPPNLKIETLEKLAKALKTKPSHLLEG